MAFTGPAICNDFKVQLLKGNHAFLASGGHTFKLALYDNSATLTKSTTAYTTSGQIASGGGYTTGGATLTNVDPVLSGDTAYIDFADPSWAGATFTTYGALLYNSSVSNFAVLVIDFGGAKSPVGGTFVVEFPAAAAATAVLTLT